MKKSIEMHKNKILKLTNVLIFDTDVKDSEDEEKNIVTILEQMENYIKSRGAMPIGPLVQKTKYEINEEGQLEIRIYLMRQANNFIHHVDTPYSMEPVIRVRNCMYARYIGPEEKLKFAYDKINLAAFEEDIELADESYTIFVDQQDDNIIADVFVEKKND